jgi:hypothetical protein
VFSVQCVRGCPGVISYSWKGLCALRMKPLRTGVIHHALGMASALALGRDESRPYEITLNHAVTNYSIFSLVSRSRMEILLKANQAH